LTEEDSFSFVISIESLNLLPCLPQHRI
jgi:hypothetical protein